MSTVKTFSSADTKKFGVLCAREILKAPRRKGAIVYALDGELGAGKTTFVQGFFRGLGLKEKAVSPTFIIMRRTALKGVAAKKFKNIFHMDAYRLKKAEELAVLEFGEILSDPKNIILIEWAGNIKKALPKDSFRLRFMHKKKENERLIRYASAVK